LDNVVDFGGSDSGSYKSGDGKHPSVPDREAAISFFDNLTGVDGRRREVGGPFARLPGFFDMAAPSV
jgi:hypothetical protein